jgi:uncharacterized protein
VDQPSTLTDADADANADAGGHVDADTSAPAVSQPVAAPSSSTPAAPEPAPALTPTPTPTQVHPADAPPAGAAAATTLGFPEGEPQHLDPLHIEAQLIANWILTGALALSSGVALMAIALGGGLRGFALLWRMAAAAVVVSAVALGGRRWTYLEHARTIYVVSPAGFEMQRGVIWRRIITVPRSRIQHTDVKQGPLQRAFGLATLVLFTAGTEHAKIELSGVKFDTAMAIRHYLLQRPHAESEPHGDERAVR